MALRLGWVGLGQMGQAHVANLLAKGFELTVYNRDTAKAQAAVAAGAAVAASPCEVVQASDVTFVMLSNASVALDVYKQPELGLLAGVCCATISSTIHHPLALTSASC